MKRHTGASPGDIGRRDESGAAPRVGGRTHASFKEARRAHAAAGAPKLALANANVRVHTLVLKGELTHRSAHALEAEIDRVCDDGVSAITLDLRELTYIDQTGVTVIALRRGLCRRRGYGFEVIPGSPLVHRAFAEAGLSELLEHRQEDIAAAGVTR